MNQNIWVTDICSALAECVAFSTILWSRSFNLSRGFLNIEVNENIDLLAWHHETNNILFLFLNVSAEARVGQ